MPVKRPLPRRRPAVASDPKVPPSDSRSALVVLHHLDGFLRSTSRGLVASRCRSWGSPRFRSGRPVEDRNATGLSRGAGSVPLEEIPFDSRDASPRPLPPCRSLPITAPSRLSPLLESALSGWEDRERRLRGLAPSFGSGVWRAPLPACGTLFFLGFVPLQGSFPTIGDPVSRRRFVEAVPPRKERLWFVRAPLEHSATAGRSRGGEHRAAAEAVVRREPRLSAGSWTFRAGIRRFWWEGEARCRTTEAVWRGAADRDSGRRARSAVASHRGHRRIPISSDPFETFTARAVHTRPPARCREAEGSSLPGRTRGDKPSMPSKSVRS